MSGPTAAFRVVLDTSVFLAGLVSKSSASQRAVDLLMARKAAPLISEGVMTEYRAILLHPIIVARFPGLTPKRVAMALHRLRYVSDTVAIGRVRFAFQRDPNDAKFIELAIAGNASHIVTLDADLLSLPTGRSDASKRFANGWRAWKFFAQVCFSTDLSKWFSSIRSALRQLRRFRIFVVARLPRRGL